MASKDPLIGREIKFYRIVDKIGGGAFGAVYRAEHTRLSKPFAIKVLHPHIASDEVIVSRFEREAQTLATLNHPNIVQLVDFDRDDEFGLYLVMEWLRGASMKQIIQKKKRLPLDVTIEFFQHLLSGLQEAHEHGIVHRDLKPANLMIIPAGSHQILKILDFGVASLSSDDRDLTMMGAAMGSANYMSPEQAMGNIKEVDSRSDLYSCGVILGHCLTGKRVFLGDTPTQTLMKHINEPPRSLAEMCPEEHFPPQIEAVFAKSLAKRKEDRYQSAREFLDAIVEASKSPAMMARPRRSGAPAVTGIFQITGAPNQTGAFFAPGFQAPHQTGTFQAPHQTGAFAPLTPNSGNVAAAARPHSPTPATTGSFMGLPDPLAQGGFRQPPPAAASLGSPARPVAGLRSTLDNFPAQQIQQAVYGHQPNHYASSDDDGSGSFSRREEAQPHAAAPYNPGGQSISSIRSAQEAITNERAAAPRYAREVLSLPGSAALQAAAEIAADAVQLEGTRARRDWRTAQEFRVAEEIKPKESAWERFERILDKHLRELIIAVVVIALVGIGLLAWRLMQPRTIQPKPRPAQLISPELLPETISPRPRTSQPLPAPRTQAPAPTTPAATPTTPSPAPKTTTPTPQPRLDNPAQGP